MQITKKLFPLAISFMMVFLAITPGIAYANDAITVTIDGHRVIFEDQAPVIVDGRTLVPVRGVFEALGFVVGWDGDTQTATLTSADYSVSITIGSGTFTTNGVSHSLDVPAQIIGGRTMLPMRAVLESVGFEVDWDAANRTVVIETQATPAFDVAAFTRELFELFDAQVSAADGSPLQYDETLQEIARQYIRYMIENDIQYTLDIREIFERLDISIAEHTQTHGGAVRWNWLMEPERFAEMWAVDPTSPNIGIAIHQEGEFLFTAVLQGSTPAIANVPTTPTPDLNISAAELERRAFEIVNDARAARGLSRLPLDENLSAAARRQSEVNGTWIGAGSGGHGSNWHTPFVNVSYFTSHTTLEARVDALDLIDSWAEVIFDPAIVRIGSGVTMTARDGAEIARVIVTFATAEKGPAMADPFNRAILLEAGLSHDEIRHVFEQEIFRITNLQRVNAGLPAFEWSEELAQAARDHSRDLIHNRVGASHVGSDGSDRSERAISAGWQGRVPVGENVVMRRIDTFPVHYVEAWMNSTGHALQMFWPTTTHLGVGLYLSDVEWAYHGQSGAWSMATQKFGGFGEPPISDDDGDIEIFIPQMIFR